MLNSSLKTMEDLDTYAENTVSPIYYLLLEAIGLYFKWHIIVTVYFNLQKSYSFINCP